MGQITCPRCHGKGKVEDMYAIGAELRSKRERVGTPGIKIAAIMGITRAYLSDLERGRRQWSPRLIMNFSRALSIVSANKTKTKKERTVPQ